eukprot:2815418-Amphidinium_carterae.1
MSTKTTVLDLFASNERNSDVLQSLSRSNRCTKVHERRQGGGFASEAVLGTVFGSLGSVLTIRAVCLQVAIGCFDG